MLLPADIIEVGVGVGWVVESESEQGVWETNKRNKKAEGRKNKKRKAEVVIASEKRFRVESPRLLVEDSFPWWSREEERARLEEYNAVERQRAMAWFLYGVVLEEEER
jgi:hypothetical protein